MIGLGFDKVEKVFNDDFIIEDGTGWIRALQACDKLDRNLFTLHTLHIHFICKTKLQSKSLIQSQMVESSVHSGVVLINQTPNIHIKLGIRLNQLKVFHIFYLYLFGITSCFLSPVLQSIGP
ncbi:hypothetical protein NC653_017946 [Populus alba x Populus x berolinensis]|uniref:Uncharacterized protein n=1 Tax=Populus alba x Populus x berolinensis TaxID=444605 RepID=A0AAD6QRL0_9ROSI|nr:hypothetical protein NC653_017946 [Populus alba x Populus x berolinensis]